MKLPTLALATLATLTSSCAVRVTPSEPSPREVVRAFQRMALEDGRPADAVRTYFAPEFVHHLGDGQMNREELAQILGRPRDTPFSNTEYQFIVEGDLVAVHHYVAPVNDPDGGTMAVDIFRVQHGLIVEHWDVRNKQKPWQAR